MYFPHTRLRHVQTLFTILRKTPTWSLCILTRKLISRTAKNVRQNESSRQRSHTRQQSGKPIAGVLGGYTVTALRENAELNIQNPPNVKGSENELCGWRAGVV